MTSIAFLIVAVVESKTKKPVRLGRSHRIFQGNNFQLLNSLSLRPS